VGQLPHALDHILGDDDQLLVVQVGHGGSFAGLAGLTAVVVQVGFVAF